MVIILCPKCLSSNVNSDPSDETYIICLNENCPRHRIYKEVEE